MGRDKKFRALLGAIWIISFPTPVYAEFALVPGHIYTANADSREILQVTPEGLQVGSLAVPGYTLGFRGLAFGPDGILYVVAAAAHGFDVVLINGESEVKGRYPGTTYVQGSASYGKIAVASNRLSYVTGQGQLIKVDRYVPGTTSIYQANQIYDVCVLPTGNLLVLSAYKIDEIMPGGQFVRQLTLGATLSDARGLEYHSATNKLFVTMLGSSSQLMRFDGTAGILERHLTFAYGDDISLFADGRLIVGSNTQPPTIFTADLDLVGAISGTERNFVVVMPAPISIFQDGMELFQE